MKTFRLPTLSRRAVFKALRRRWLQLTAPKWARETWKPAGRKPVRICNMGDAHLLNTIAYLRREAEEGYVCAYRLSTTPRPILNVMIREASRRRLTKVVEAMARDEIPKWVAEENAAFGERQKAKRAALLINGENGESIDVERAKKRAGEIMRTVLSGRYPG